MTGYLLDTNVISEVTKNPPDVNVTSFLSRQEDLWIPIIALHELAFGVQRLEPGQKRLRLEVALTAFVAEFGERIISLHQDAAEHAASLRAQAERHKRKLTMADALIAGTAIAEGLTLATRNVKDFEHLEVDLVNPWLSGRLAY